jgi:hypothetical protein
MKIAYFRFKYSIGNSGELIGYFSYEFNLNDINYIDRTFLFKKLEDYILLKEYKLIEIISLEIY